MLKRSFFQHASQTTSSSQTATKDSKRQATLDEHFTTQPSNLKPLTVLKNGYCVSTSYRHDSTLFDKQEKEKVWGRLMDARKASTIRQVTDKRRSDLLPNEVLATHPRAWPKDIRKHSRPEKVADIRKTGWIRFPPRFGAEYFGAPKTDGVNEGEAAPNFKPSEDFALLEELKQPEAVEAVLAHVARDGGTILKAPTGCGKTATGLFLASKWGRKTMVLVHKDDVMKSWVETAKQWFPTASVGIIKGNKFEIDCDIVIAMIQTLTKRDVTPDTVKHIGTLIVDEAHHYGSSWGDVLYALHCKHMLALTATPENALGPVLSWWFGDVAYTFKRPTGHSTVTRVLFHRDGPHRQLITIPGYDTPDFTTMIKQLVADEERNGLLAKAITKDAKENLAENEGLLVLTTLREHAVNLAQLIREQGGDAAHCIGDMKDGEREEAKTHQIIVSTFSFLSEGSNILKLRRLWLACSRSKIKQSAGRIVRGVCEHVGAIMDVVDDFSVFERQWYRRRGEYAEEGIVISNYTTLDKMAAG
jgi:superfamily II DNA or RNA helicase